MTYLMLFYEYFKAGLFAIGGGLATLPFLYDISDRTGWFTYAELADMIAVSESTPGPIGVNMATYVGFKVGGVGGSLCATLGLIAPSLIIIIIISMFLKAFRNNKYVDRAFYSLRPASAALIASAGITVFCSSVLNIDLFKATGAIFDLISVKYIILGAAILFLSNKFKNVHPAVFIIISAFCGIVFAF